MALTAALKTTSYTVLLFVLSLFVCVSRLHATQQSDQYSPEHSTELSNTSNKQLVAKKQIVVTAHPLASEVSNEILNSGGNAVDAAIAAQLVLGLVEPQSSGIGGGAFSLLYLSETQKLTTYDGRETAPTNIPIDIFLDADKQPLSFFDAVIGGRSVGTPGTPSLLWKMHKDHGKLEWKKIFEPAIKLAIEGFIVSKRFASSVARDAERLKTDPVAHAYFFPNGAAISAGQTLKNPEYAKTLTFYLKMAVMHSMTLI